MIDNADVQSGTVLTLIPRKLPTKAVAALMVGLWNL
jgi:hypothetical protein